MKEIRRTWNLVGQVSAVASKTFYERLFQTDTSVVPLFNGVDMSHQGQQMCRTLLSVWAAAAAAARVLVLATAGTSNTCGSCVIV